VSTFAELRAALSGVRDVGDDGFEIAVPLSNAWTTHAVRGRGLDVAGAPWVELVSEIGAVRSMSPLFLLGESFKTPVGMVGVARGVAVLRLTLPISGLLVSDVAESIQALAHHAAEWRRQLELHFR
jgi:hypothetical protein